MRLSRLSTAAAVLTAVVAGCGSSSGSSQSPDRSRRIESGLSVRRGEKRPLYVVHGRAYPTVGRLVVGCTRNGLAKTAYVVARRGPDALVAVEGRGASRGARLAIGLARQSLPGGTKPSGIEHWVMRTGGEPEEIELDASLLALSAPVATGPCELSLDGTLTITGH